MKSTQLCYSKCYKATDYGAKFEGSRYTTFVEGITARLISCQLFNETCGMHVKPRFYAQWHSYYLDIKSYMKTNQDKLLIAKSPSEETVFLMGQMHLRQGVLGRFCQLFLSL